MKTTFSRSTSRRRHTLTLGRLLRSCIAVGLFLSLADPALAVERGPSWDVGSTRLSRSLQPSPTGLARISMGNSISDPTGDTFGTGPLQLDIVDLSANVVGGVLRVTIDFAQPISANPNDANSPVGMLDIDADQNGATGEVGWTDTLTGTDVSGLGIEYYVDLFSYDSVSSTADLLDSSTETEIGRAALTFAPNQLIIEVPTLLIGGASVDLAAVIGTVEEPTDRAPNAGSISPTQTPTVSGCRTVQTGDTSACVSDANTACMLGNRFAVGATFEDFEGVPGVATMIESNDLTTIGWFFQEDNFEFMLKVLDGCTVNQRFWVFAGGLTDVQTEITVRDSTTGEAYVCTNESGTEFSPIRDTSAFATCP